MTTRLFGIGTYQPIANATTYAGGFPTQAFQLVHPYAGVYGGTYGFLLDTHIRAPSEYSYTPAQEIGMDGTGVPVVRGYPQITWSYNTLRSDYWYYFKLIYDQSGRNAPGFQYLVLIQYPDPNKAGTLTQSLARFDPPTHNHRDVGAYYGVQLKFTYVGQAQLAGNVSIVLV